jgi:hypothetical protein
LKDKIDDADRRKQEVEANQRNNVAEIERIESRKAKKETEIKKERKKVRFLMFISLARI